MTCPSGLVRCFLRFSAGWIPISPKKRELPQLIWKIFLRQPLFLCYLKVVFKNFFHKLKSLSKATRLRTRIAILEVLALC